MIDATVEYKLDLLEEERIDNHNDEKDDDSNVDTDTEGDIVMVDAAVQQKLKLSLSDADDRINDLREYAKDSGAPPANINLLSKLERNLRAHNASKSRQQKSMESYFSKK